MIDYENANLLLGVAYGWLAILVTAMTWCLITYVRQFNMTWNELLIDNTRPGVRLAKPMIIIKIGMLGLLSFAWYWRIFNLGEDMTPVHFFALLISVAILTVGGLWLVRILSWPRYGEKAWLLTLATMLVFLAATFMVVRF